MLSLNSERGRKIQVYQEPKYNQHKYTRTHQVAGQLPGLNSAVYLNPEVKLRNQCNIFFHLRALRIFKTAEMLKDVPGEIPEICQAHAPVF